MLWCVFLHFFFHTFLSMCNHSALDLLFRGVTDAQSIELCGSLSFLPWCREPPIMGPTATLPWRGKNRWGWKLNHVLKGSCRVPVLILLMQGLLLPPVFSWCVCSFNCIPFQREQGFYTLIKTNHWIKWMFLFLVACFIITYWLFLITLFLLL